MRQDEEKKPKLLLYQDTHLEWSKTKCKIQIQNNPDIYSDEEVEDPYEDLETALQILPTYYTIIMGNFNAKFGFKQVDTEVAMGTYEYDERNE